MSLWSRDKDPHTTEELMIAEYYRQLDNNEKLTKELEEERIAHEQEVEALNDKVLEKEETISNLQTVLNQNKGVVDLHEEVTARYVDILSDYYIDDIVDYPECWPSSGPAIKKDEEESEDDSCLDPKLAVLKEIYNMEDAALWEYATNCKFSYHEPLIEYKVHTFKHLLQVPYNDDLHRRLFDPAVHKNNLYAYNTKPEERQWTVCDEEAIKKFTLPRLRSKLSKTYSKLYDKLNKKDQENG